MREPCKSCGAPIAWLNHQRTNRPAPIETDVNPAGNVIATDVTGAICSAESATHYRIATKDERERWRVSVDGPIYASHFSSCPAAARHRRSA